MRKPPRRIARLDEMPAVKRVTPVKRLEPAGRMEGWICSPRPWIFVTHWTGKRSTPHFTPDETCEGCKSQLPKRPRGYVLLFSGHYRIKWFAELTEGATEKVQLWANGESIRGCYLSLTRERGKWNAPMLADISRLDQAPSDLPADEDPAPTLSVLWGMNGELC